MHIRLAGDTDFQGFRSAARDLLKQGVAPRDAVFTTSLQDAGLFEDAPAPVREAPRPVPAVSREFLSSIASASLHRDPGRFGLIYRILWRLADEPGLARIASDPDIARLGSLAKAVRRDIHKMHAFVRFRAVEAPDGEAFIAWYEPDHHVVEAAAPFFARRFASLLWTILTPERCVRWTGEHLEYGDGADRSLAPTGDDLEELWRRYYASVFNPARVNPTAMRAEMPRRFWRNLPEAQLIQDLVAEAPSRAAAMVAAAPTLPVLRRGATMVEKTGDKAVPLGLPALAEQVQGCRACPLWEPATQGVPGEGPSRAPLMIVGEQPGDEEDLAGRPFVGPAGRLLDKALAQAGVPREAVYVTNAVKHFKFEPRGKRRIHKKPEAREIKACLPWLDQEMALVAPGVVVMLGATAAQAVLGHAVPVTRIRGEVLDLAGGRRGLVTTHPSYVLRLPDRSAAEAAFDALVRDLAQAWVLARPGSG
jgi:DNA polymerase